MDRKKTALQTGERGAVRAVDRALDILLCFGAERDLGLTEIARRVDLHKSTAHRMLASLERRGFVERHSLTDRYRLGWLIVELASQVFQSDNLTSLALAEMTHLRDAIGETISLYVRSGYERIRVSAVEGTHPVRRAANIGKRFPLYVGASGKVLLAFSDQDILGELDRAQSVPAEFNIDELRAQCSQIAAEGYAVSIEEREAGAAAVAAPIRNRQGICVAALSVSGPVDRFTAEQVTHFATVCMEAASRISRTLGIYPANSD